MFYEWRPYVPVAERRRKAEREMQKLRKKGRPVSPVVVEGRTIARTFWGKAWCDNLERYSDYSNRLPRGRTYVRNGSVLDLQIAKCRMSVATRADFDYEAAVKQGSRIRVATKYVAVARQHFADKGVHVDLIKLYGSMELAPLTGLADAIVDLVSTGSTLKANRLVEVERIMDISSLLVVNQAALKLKQAPLRRIIDAFAAAVPA